MTTVTLKFNENSKSGKFVKKLLDAIVGFTDVKVIEEKTPNPETQKAMENVKSGKTTKTNGVDDFLQQMNL
jgi:hypothetical protein